MRTHIPLLLAAGLAGLDTASSAPIFFRDLNLGGLVGGVLNLLPSTVVGLLGVATGNGVTINDLENGPCMPYTLIFARGTAEQGNMGNLVGPLFCAGLKSALGSNKVACQGVGSPYAAAIPDNFLPLGTSTVAIGEATRLFNLARTKCPSTKVIAGGYSQGAAVMHGSISTLPSNVQSMIRGAVMFGDSRNVQDKGRIPNYPTSQTMIICLPGDTVCLGTDFLTPAHIAYESVLSLGINFVQQILG